MTDQHIHFAVEFDDGQRLVVQPITTSTRVSNAWLVFGPSMAGVVAGVAVFGTTGYVGTIGALCLGIWSYMRPRYAVIKGARQ